MRTAKHNDFLIIPDRVAIWKIFYKNYTSAKSFGEELLRLSEEDMYITLRAIFHCPNSCNIMIERQDGMCSLYQACQRIRKMFEVGRERYWKIYHEITARLVAIVGKYDSTYEWDRRFKKIEVTAV